MEGDALTGIGIDAVEVDRFRRVINRTPGVVYVTSQGLYYDTFVVKDPLPMEGRFQLLTNGQTEFGPGQAGYLGGRGGDESPRRGAGSLRLP